MIHTIKYFSYLTVLLLVSFQSYAQQQSNAYGLIERNFTNPPAAAKPWVFWYWMHSAVSKAGITADLEAMKEVGIGGAYLMPIKDTSSAIPFSSTARQLTPEWWQLVKFAMQEAKRLDLQLAMHVSDGFALAGGPWITPELSMQKLVWTKTYVKAGSDEVLKLEQPETVQGFYKDLAVFAYPASSSYAFSDKVLIPHVTTSNGTRAQFLSFPDAENKQSFKSDTSCWVQYKYPETFTCRSIRIHTGGNNYQAQRLIVQAGDDGVHFKTITRLQPPRQGWQDTDEDYTHAIPVTTAKYFRFVYDKEGSEPGAEDLDAAKWKPSFKVMGIYLSDEPVIHQYEAKNGSVWRIAANTTTEQVSDNNAVPLKDIIDLTGKMDNAGNLNWRAPADNLPDGKAGWVLVRIGHTSTGHTNATGGAAKGLECDKFNVAAVTMQFNNWFAQAFEKTDAVAAKEVLKVFHVDSWECGSQNWSTAFPGEFKKRRGYELTPYLLAMAGVPVEDAATSEKFLHDVRQTIAELVNDVFYVTLNKLAHEKGCHFSAESVAPTMVSDGMLHYKNVDIPMGEFWLNSPTHDKPNDMLDAISSAHVYGKNIIQAEAFTSLRMNWREHPGNLKAVGDRNFALGINKMVLHVFTHNPWLDKKPGMTLDGIGLYFQRDQTWFKQSKAWIDYLTRCQALLQSGKPVVDLAIFTGEELPRRSLLPDRLVNTLPGIFGKEKVSAEKKRLANSGQPLRTIPDGVNHAANMAGPEDWIDPLNGYAYDSFNPDVLMQMSVKSGRVILPGGASYALLVLPAKHPMLPDSSSMSVAVAKKLLQLVKGGATILMSKGYKKATGLKENDDSVKLIIKELFKTGNKKGRVIPIPYADSSFNKLGVQKDVQMYPQSHSIAWTHRRSSDTDLYFVANQKDSVTDVVLSFRIAGKEPELWDAVTGKKMTVKNWSAGNRTYLTCYLEANQSVFIVFRKKRGADLFKVPFITENVIAGPWEVQFDENYGGPPGALLLDSLRSWSTYPDTMIRYYSGTVVYSTTFHHDKREEKTVLLKFDSICNIATVKVNGMDCGTLWTKPFSIDITKAVKPGENKIEMEVTNTWHNRLIGDSLLPPGKRITWTTAPFRLKDKPLLPAGLMGKVKLIIQ